MRVILGIEILWLFVGCLFNMIDEFRFIPGQRIRLNGVYLWSDFFVVVWVCFIGH